MALADHRGGDEPGPDRASRRAARGLQPARDVLRRALHRRATTSSRDAGRRSRCAPTGCAASRTGGGRQRQRPQRHVVREVEYQGTYVQSALESATGAAELTAISSDAAFDAAVPSRRQSSRVQLGRHGDSTPWRRRLSRRAATARARIRKSGQSISNRRTSRRQEERVMSNKRQGQDGACLAPRPAEGRRAPLLARRGFGRRITGFPGRLVAGAKVLRYLGTAVNQSDDITKKVKAETGITHRIHCRRRPTT